MSCERFREQIPECLAGRLESDAREKLIAHLELCSTCRGDMAEMGAVWRGLESMPVPEPDPAMHSRFMEVLEAYQAGVEQGRTRAVAPLKRSWWTLRWWPARAAWQAALAVVLVAAGGLGGRYLARPHAASNPEIAQLQSQVENLRQTVALSMLQDQSSSSRIRGVTYASQIGQPDKQIDQALLFTLSHDANVNVRLRAVDALENLAVRPEIQRAMVDALPLQDSPLVKAAIIDVLAEVNDKAAVPALREIMQDSKTDLAVRQKAAAAVQKLEVSK